MLKPNLKHEELERLATAALALSNALDESDPEMTSLAQYRDPLVYELVNCLDTFELQTRPKEQVFVEVNSGIADVTQVPDWIDVRIIDHDNGEELVDDVPCPKCQGRNVLKYQNGYYCYACGKMWVDANAQSGLCPICGEHVTLNGKTVDGRFIGSCGDAFTQKQWEAEDD